MLRHIIHHVPFTMFTVLGALAVVGGSIPLIKKGTEGQNENEKNNRHQHEVDRDPVSAALLGAKTLSQSLSSPISGHGLSQVTSPPSILVPSHTPQPPLPDLQVLTTVLTACRKHGLNSWGSQSVFVKGGLDMGLWVGPIDIAAGDFEEEAKDERLKKKVSSEVIERLTGGKSGRNVLLQSLALTTLPLSTESDNSLQGALNLLDMRIIFSLPETVEGKQAFFLVGQNSQTNNWLAVAAAKGNTASNQSHSDTNISTDAVSQEGSRTESSSETVAESASGGGGGGITDTAIESCSSEPAKGKEKISAVPEISRRRRRNGGKRRTRQSSPPSLSGPSSPGEGLEEDVIKQTILSDVYEKGTKEIQNNHGLSMRPANSSSLGKGRDKRGNRHGLSEVENSRRNRRGEH